VSGTMDNVDGLFGGLASHPVGDGVVDRSDHVAEDAVLVLGFRWRPSAKCSRNPGSSLRVCVSDVTIAPGRPEAIHSPSIAGVTASGGQRSGK
jgi:hypothetical protein